MPDTRNFLEDIKQRIPAARVSVARAVHRELILLFWDIAQGILSRRRDLGWGEAVVEALARDLRVEFPLKTKGNPIGIANYYLQPDLPTQLKGKLPSARQLANAVRPMLPPGCRQAASRTLRQI